MADPVRDALEQRDYATAKALLRDRYSSKREATPAFSVEHGWECECDGCEDYRRKKIGLLPKNEPVEFQPRESRFFKRPKKQLAPVQREALERLRDSSNPVIQKVVEGHRG